MKLITQPLICFAIAFLLGGCDGPKPERTVFDPVTRINDQTVNAESLEEKVDADQINKKYLEPKEIEFNGFKFRFGYEKYNEEKFGFSNPGFLHVLKNGKVIFKDSFKGEGEIFVESLGYHELSGNKLIFTLNWGTEACDYSQYSRYFYITPENKVHFLNEYWSSTGGDGYASRYYKHILPEDSAGVSNALLIIEGMEFHEHDQPDQSDTTRIAFNGNSYKLIKLTNNLGKVKGKRLLVSPVSDNSRF
jgi:hypothetical protein